MNKKKKKTSKNYLRSAFNTMVLTWNDRSKYNCKCIASSLYLLFEVIILQRGETISKEHISLYLPLQQHFCLEFFLDRFFLKVPTTVDILFQKNNYKCSLGLLYLDHCWKSGISLNVIFSLERLISVLFTWLNHTNASEQNDFISEQSKKVCSIKYELGQRDRLHYLLIGIWAILF